MEPLKKLIGFVAFWIAVGMLLMLFLAHHYLIALIIIAPSNVGTFKVKRTGLSTSSH